MNKFMQPGSILKKIALLFLVVNLAACSKKSDPFIAKEVTAQELLNYYIVSEIRHKNKPETKPFLQVTWFMVDGANIKTKSEIQIATYTDNIKIDYDEAKGITTLKGTSNPHFNITRDRLDNIILSGKATYENAELEVLHSELIKTPVLSYHSNTLYKGVENNQGYFRFNNKKWLYSATDNFSALNWNFIANNNFLWTGYDGGTTGWFNFFVAIPKGNGWKGQRKDKDLLLVSYTHAGNSVDGVVVCERQ